MKQYSQEDGYSREDRIHIIAVELADLYEKLDYYKRVDYSIYRRIKDTIDTLEYEKEWLENHNLI